MATRRMEGITLTIINMVRSGYLQIDSHKKGTWEWEYVTQRMEKYADDFTKRDDFETIRRDFIPIIAGREEIQEALASIGNISRRNQVLRIEDLANAFPNLIDTTPATSLED